MLFHYTHDILRSPLAHGSAAGCSRTSGATVAIAGVKYFPRWLAPLNLVGLSQKPPVTTAARAN